MSVACVPRLIAALSGSFFLLAACAHAQSKIDPKSSMRVAFQQALGDKFTKRELANESELTKILLQFVPIGTPLEDAKHAMQSAGIRTYTEPKRPNTLFGTGLMTGADDNGKGIFIEIALAKDNASGEVVIAEHAGAWETTTDFAH